MSDKIATMHCPKCEKRMPVGASYMVPGENAHPAIKEVKELEILFCIICDTVTNMENTEIIYEDQGWEGWTAELEEDGG